MSPKWTNKFWNSTLVLLPLLIQGDIFTRWEWIILDLDYISRRREVIDNLHMLSLLLLGCVLPPSQLQTFWWGVKTAWQNPIHFQCRYSFWFHWNLLHFGSMEQVFATWTSKAVRVLRAWLNMVSWPNWATFLVWMKSSVAVTLEIGWPHISEH